MSSRIKQILGAGVPFGIVMCLAWIFIAGWPSGLAIVVAILTGLLFGFTMTAFANSAHVREITQPTLESAEQILYDGPANHFQGLEAVGGRLFLTNRRLIFKSHRLNLKNREWSILLQEITLVQAVQTLGMIPSGIRIQSRTGHPERFVVIARSEWMQRIAAERLATHVA